MMIACKGGMTNFNANLSLIRDTATMITNMTISSTATVIRATKSLKFKLFELEF